MQRTKRDSFKYDLRPFFGAELGSSIAPSSFVVHVLTSGGGLNRCSHHLFKAINQWKIENGKWKNLAPSPDWGRLGWGFFSRKHFVLPPPTLPQVGGGNCFPCQTFSMKVFTDYSPLEGRWQGEGSSRVFVMLNLFQHLTSLAFSTIIDKILNLVQDDILTMEGSLCFP